MEFGETRINFMVESLPLFQLIYTHPSFMEAEDFKRSDKSPLLEADLLYVGLFMKTGRNSNIFLFSQMAVV
jgi:hypothetical protein